MGLLSNRLGLWTCCAAIASAILALSTSPAEAATPTPNRTASHAHRQPGKRALIIKPAPSRGRAGVKGAKGQKGAVTPASVQDDAGKSSDAKSSDAGKKEATKKDVARKEMARREPAVPASSVGSPNEGKLVGGVKLDTSDGTVRVVPAYARGDTRWGLPALIHMIERSAKKVAKKNPGAVLGVGDISRKNGGDIFLHRSHESGRDADIAFYVVDRKGKNLLPETFVQFQGSIESSSMPGARFDVSKNWQLVQAMLEDPVARVSHIFVADPLRRMLLAHARTRVSPALYNRAAAVMMQPSNALPHDNHFHVRISCPAEMRKSCVEFPAGVFAKKSKARGKPVIVTPGKRGVDGQAQAQAALSHRPRPAVKPAAQAHAHASRSVTRVPAAPAARRAPEESALAAASAPKKKPIYLQSAAPNTDDPLDRVLFSVPALSHLGVGDPDGDGDAADVKASVDESGTVKITE